MLRFFFFEWLISSHNDLPYNLESLVAKSTADVVRL